MGTFSSTSVGYGARGPYAEERHPRRVVWKFSATSLADLAHLRTVAQRLVTAHHDGIEVVAVLSALGSTIDELTAMAHNLSLRPSLRELDALLSAGESMSCALAATAVHGLGERAVSLSAAQNGVLTDAAYGNARLRQVDPERAVAALADGAIVFVAGSQGTAPNGDVTRLGRGGSDTTAIALATALGLEHCEIFTDVTGVFTADPRLVANARKLERLSHEDMLCLALAGAQILQPRAVELAAENRIDIHVRSPHSTDVGTWIAATNHRGLERDGVIGVAYRHREPVYTVVGLSDRAVIAALRKRGAHGGSVVNSGDRVRFTAPGTESAVVLSAFSHARTEVSIQAELSSVSVVGPGIGDRPEIAERVKRTLGSNGIDPQLVMTTSSQVSCFLPGDAVERAVNVLHEAFELHLDRGGSVAATVPGTQREAADRSGVHSRRPADADGPNGRSRARRVTPAPHGPAGDPRRGRKRRSLLTNVDFLKVWGGETVSMFGDQVTDLALPLVAIVTLSASAFEIGLLDAAREVPPLFIALFAGVWFDRNRRRPILVASNIGRAVLIGLVPVAAMTHVLSIGLLCVVAFLTGLLAIMFQIGIQAYVPRMVKSHHLDQANAKIATSEALAGIGGPGLGGFLVGTLTPPVALTIDAVSFLVSAAGLMNVHAREPTPTASAFRTWWAAPRWARFVHSEMVVSIRAGLRAVFRNPILRGLALMAGSYNTFFQMMLTVFLVYTIRELHMSASQLGLILAIEAVGSLLGATMANQLRKFLKVGSAMRVAWFFSCAAPPLLLLPTDPSTASLVALGATLAVVGASVTVLNINVITLRQRVTPDHLLGRMNASYRLFINITNPVGAVVGGSLAAIYGLRTALTVGVFGVAAMVIWLGLSPAFRVRKLPESPPATVDPAPRLSNRNQSQAEQRKGSHDDAYRGTRSAAGSPAPAAPRASASRQASRSNRDSAA